MVGESEKTMSKGGSEHNNYMGKDETRVEAQISFRELPIGHLFEDA